MCCFIILLPFLSIGAITAVVLFLGSLQTLLDRCARWNRDMTPGLVWLNLVPVFNLFWCFRTMISVGRSMKSEFAERELDPGVDYATPVGIVGASIGIAAWLGPVAAMLVRADQAKIVALVVWLGLSFVCVTLGLIYWISIRTWLRRLQDDDRRRRNEDRHRALYDALDHEDDRFPRRDDPGRSEDRYR
jgi:hypothetical protein